MCLRVVILFTSISRARGQMEYRGYLGASLSSLNCIISIISIINNYIILQPYVINLFLKSAILEFFKMLSVF